LYNLIFVNNLINLFWLLFIICMFCRNMVHWCWKKVRKWWYIWMKDWWEEGSIWNSMIMKGLVQIKNITQNPLELHDLISYILNFRRQNLKCVILFSLIRIKVCVFFFVSLVFYIHIIWIVISNKVSNENLK